MNKDYPQKVLCVFTKYSMSKQSSYLTNELVEELSSRGVRPTVIAYEKNDQLLQQRTLPDKDEIFIGLNSGVKYIKYILAWPILFFVMAKIIMRREKYDLFIMNAPLLTMLPILFLLPFLKVEKKWVIIFDLFPIHQVQAGAIPKILGFMLHKLETWGISLFNRYGVMGERNKAMVASYYHLPIDLIHITGIWGVADDIHEKAVPKVLGKDIKMVFGGQLTAGRRLDLLIDFLSELRKAVAKEKNIVVDIFSSGHVCNQYKEKYHQYDWINFCQPLDRETYVMNLRNYDFGLIVTDENVTLPTLPSKIIDYINASISVIAMVESECELREEIYESDKIHLLPFSYASSDIQRLKRYIVSLDPSKLYAQDLKSLFSVKRTVDVLIK